MTAIYLSIAIKNASTIAAVAEIINSAALGHAEGMEGVEFTPAQLAGQYAWVVAADAKEVTKEMMTQSLDYIKDEGAKFDHAQALVHAQALADAYPADADN